MAYQGRSVTGLPPNLFSGGAVVVNPNPVVDYINNTQKLNQARDDAFSKYYADLGKNLTPSGMHADDIDDVINGKNQWQQHSMANRKALMNPSIDGGKAYAENQRLYNNTLDIAQKSKSKVANLLTVEPLIRDPKKRSLLTDDAVTAIDNAGLKVTNPKYKALNPNDIHFKDKPFDLADQSKVQGVLKNIKPEQVENEPIIDKKNGTQTINYTPKFDKNSLLNM